MTLILNRGLEYRWSYNGLKYSSEDELLYWKQKTFKSNYQYATDIVSCFAERLATIADFNLVHKFLKSIKVINDDELLRSGGNDNGDHCLVSLFISATPRAFQTKDNLQTVLALANSLNSSRLIQDQTLHWKNSCPPKEQPDKVCHLFFKQDNKTKSIIHGINLRQ